MEISIVVGEDGNKVKFIDGQKKFELSRSQLEMGIRLLDAIEGKSEQQTIINNNPTPQPMPVPPMEVTCSSNHDQVKQRPIPPLQNKKSHVALKNIKLFAESIKDFQSEYEQQDGNKKGGISEWAIKKSIIKHKGDVTKDEMFQVLRKVQNREMFEMFYSTAHTIL